MPSISFSSPGAPTLLTGLSPIAANPIAAIDGAATPAFASVIDGLGQGFTFDAPLPLKPSVGNTLPPQRPDIAGGPEPLPAIDVESVMIGAAGTIPAAPEPAVEPASIGADAPADRPDPAAPTVAADESAPSIATLVRDPLTGSGPVSEGLRHWRLDGASIPVLAHAIARPLPAPVQLPPAEMPDMPAIDLAPLPEQTKKDAPADPQAAPTQAVDAPPAPNVVPAACTPVPPEPVAEPVETEDESSVPARPALAAKPGVEPRLPQATKPADGPQPTAAQPAAPQLAPGAAPQAAQMSAPQVSSQPAALPHGFNVPPEVAREIARAVQAATDERDERGGSDAAEAAPLPVSAPSAPQVAPSQPAPLHPAFAASHRPVVDTGRAEWMQAMIDRIAEMPQAEGGRRDAQIRLVPDALGPVEVKIEQRQERLHVTLQAETPQARQLLSDAAPKLHELAEARGIRFAQAGFGSTDSQDRRQTPDQHQPATPLRPRSAAAADPDTDSQNDGDLIA